MSTVTTSNAKRGDRSGVNAYATLLARPSYLAGAMLLAYTLHKHSPSTPLIILYTPDTLPEPCTNAASTEAKRTNAVLHPVEHLCIPRNNNEETGQDEGIVAARFADAWTKLRVFEVLEVEIQGETKKIDCLCFLDADTMVLQDPSPLVFTEPNDAYLNDTAPLPTEDKTLYTEEAPARLCATHTCVCNFDADPWAPPDWTPQNCAYTHLSSPTDVAPVAPPPAPAPHRSFNSGVFLFRPSVSICEHVLAAFKSTPPSLLRRLKFPDQDFLNRIFDGRWQSLSWRVNALKTWRYWHVDVWRDDRVAVLHYIVDKPWAARVQRGEGGKLVAGYKGDDGMTHGWWWEAFGEWKHVRVKQGENALVEVVGRYVAGEGDGDTEGREKLRIVGGGAQEFARKWEGKDDVAGRKEEEEENGRMKTHGPVLRKKMLGERGHGPVVRGKGWSFMDP